VLAPYLLLAVTELVLPAAPGPAGAVAREFGLYFGAWLLGFAHHDGLLRRMPRRILLPLAGALAGGGAAWLLTHPGTRGYDLNDVRPANALWSAAFILVLLGAVPAGAAWLERRHRLSRMVTVCNSRALTIYLWHMPIVVGVAALYGLAGWPTGGVGGVASRLPVVAVLVTVAVLLFGWAEDIAARRSPVLLPGASRGPGPSPRPPPSTPVGPVSPRSVPGAAATVPGVAASVPGVAADAAAPAPRTP
jgi:peptidoglycan/LPS O-acetylase OafA/YrhL